MLILTNPLAVRLAKKLLSKASYLLFTHAIAFSLLIKSETLKTDKYVIIYAYCLP